MDVIPSSAIRYRRGEIPGQQAEADQIIRQLGSSYRPRTSRQQTQTAIGQSRRAQQFTPNTNDDMQIAPSVRSRSKNLVLALPYRLDPRLHGTNPLLWIGVGMFAFLILVSIGVHILAWCVNTLHDPAYYTQTAHLDTVTIDASGHQSQARAFIDANGHVDILAIPDGDPSKAHIFVGPALSNIDDPQQKATLAVTARGTTVTVVAQGPLKANWLTADRQREQWVINISSQGGK